MTVPRILRALLAATVFAATLVAAPRPAGAAGEYLEVSITSVSTPAIDLADPTQQIEIRGEITNVSTVAIRYVNPHFWRSTTPLTSTEAIDRALLEPPTGARLADEAAGNLDTITREEAFGPGERAEFSVRASVAQLTGVGGSTSPLPVDDVAYLVGVQVRGIPADGGNQVVGRAAAAIAATGGPTRSSAVVTLTATPSWTPEGAFLDDSLAASLATDLETRLASAERDTVVGAIDPALYEAAVALSGPHVAAGAEAAGSGVALRWVARVDALAEAGRLWRLPYGDPDLGRAEANGAFDDVLGWADASLPAALADLPSVAVLDDDAPQDLPARLAGIDTVIVRGTTGSAAGSPRVLSAATIHQVTAAPSVRQARMLAEEVIAKEPPLYLIETAEDAQHDAQLAPWRTHIAAEADQLPMGWPDVDPARAWPRLADVLGQAESSAALLADLTGTPSTSLPALGATAYSRGFDDEDAASAFVQAASPAKLDLSKVTLRAAASYVMGSRTNTFPATLSNGLGVPVTVGVEFTSDNPQRIRVPSLAPVTVGPGESETLNVTPEASANGVTLVHAQLVTAGGAPVGEPVTIEITATDFGRVGWIIIVISGVVVLGGTALRIRAVRRERARAAVEDSDDPSQ